MADPQAELLEKLSQTANDLAAVKRNVAARVIGQERVVDLSLITLLSGGHGLLVGVPGMAKTRLVETLGIVLGLNGNRVQFTPDLMPSDILGSEVLEEASDGKRSFRFIEGPVFCQLLMADEINRASPRTQSALLQAMQEYEVTIAGQERPLAAPFHVLATQNPLEQEGTYPLPEAQLDRFMMQIDVEYPDRTTERDILLATTGVDEAPARQAFTAGDLIEAQKIVRQMPVGDSIVDLILNIVRMGRPEEPEAIKAVRENISWGPGPRAAQALMLAVRARALLDGRTAPTVADVEALSRPVLKHRMALGFGARAGGVRLDDVISQMLQTAVGAGGQG